VCFDKMPTTPASYDFDYVFEEIDQSTATSSRRAARAAEIEEFVRDNTAHEVAGAKEHVHHLLAVLSVESYYASLDEAAAELAQPALKLLTAGDVHGFFTACGTHYIRSLSRRSYFLTLFSYASAETTRDRAFELRLEQEVRKFAAAGDAKQDQQFTDAVRAHSLRVVTRSIGLTARSNPNLLPFDLVSYKAGVKEAFLASQEPNAGRVVAMEITPWLSNTRVLVLLDAAAGATSREAVIERRRILADNSEFYIELVGALQQMNTQVHRAEACRRILDERVMDRRTIAPAYAGAQVVSHVSGGRLPLANLVEAVSDASIDRMRALVLGWRDGVDGKPGAQACMLELERTGLSGTYHNDIAACVWKRVQLPNAREVDEYCPPEIEVQQSVAPGAPPRP
jgi:hypothetical protein